MRKLEDEKKRLLKSVDNKSIVFINQDSGYLMIDIINAHVEAGYQCTLLTGRLIERNQKLHSSVKIDHIIRYKRNSPGKRIFTWVWASIQILVKVLLKYRKEQLFIVSNPPFAPLLPLLVRNPFSLYIFDIYPDALVDNNKAGSGRFIISLWRKYNRKIFARALKIFTLTDGMKNKLAAYKNHEIDVIPVWSDNSFLRPVPKQQNSFIIEHNLADKFIILYSGNLGYTHHTEVIADIASRVTNPGVQFVIIGEGDGKERLAARIKELQLKNCTMLPWQPPEVLPFSMASADLGIVSLGSNSVSLSIPSKTFSLMSVGAPLLCLAPEDSDLGKLVNHHKNGQCFSHNDLDGIVQYIHHVAKDKPYREELSDNSLKASLEYTGENAKRFVLGE